MPNPIIDGVTIGGTTYDLKDPNLTEEVSDLKSALSGVESLADFVSVPFKIADSNHFIRYSDGEMSSSISQNFCASDFIDISKFTKLKFKRVHATGSTTEVGTAFYDESRTFISGIPNTVNASTMVYTLFETPVPDGAKFARFSILKDTTTYGEFEIFGESKITALLDANFNEITGIWFIDGKTIKTDTSTVDLSTTYDNATMRYAVVNVSEGDVFTISGTGGVSARLWCFVDSNNTVISVSDENSLLDNDIIVAPTGSDKLIIQTQVADKLSYKGKTSKGLFNDLYTQVAELSALTTNLDNDVKTLDNDVNNYYIPNHLQGMKWVNGAILRGVESDSSTRIRSDYIRFSEADVVATNSGYEFNISFYNDNKEYIGDIGSWVTEYLVKNTGFGKIVVRRANDSNIHISESNNVYVNNGDPMLNLVDKIETDLSLKIKADSAIIYAKDLSYSVSNITTSKQKAKAIGNFFEIITDESYIDSGYYLSQNLLDGVGQLKLSSIKITNTKGGNVNLRVFARIKGNLLYRDLGQSGIATGSVTYTFNDELLFDDIRINSYSYNNSIFPCDLTVEISGSNNNIELGERAKSYTNKLEWEVGTIINGVEEESDTRLRSSYFFADAPTKAIAETGYLVNYVLYDKYKNFVSQGGSWEREVAIIGQSESTPYARILVKKENDSEIDTSALSNITILLGTLNALSTLQNEINEIRKSATDKVTSPIKLATLGLACYLDTVKHYSSTDMTGWNSSYTVSDLYAFYDNLVSLYPDYITKTDLGADTSGTYHLYEYHFNPETIGYENINGGKPETSNEVDLPLFLVDGTIHGNEHLGSWIIKSFVDKLCNHWEEHEAFTFFRWNCQFKIIPTANPWGFDNNKRQNSSNLDLNRQFLRTDAQLEVDAKEALIIRNWLNANSNAFAFIDCHTAWAGKDRDIAWLASSNRDTDNFVNGVITYLSRKWQNQYDFIEYRGLMGYGGEFTYANPPQSYSIAYAYKTLGMPYAFSFEIANTVQYNGETYMGKLTADMYMDLFVNTMVAFALKLGAQLS